MRLPFFIARRYFFSGSNLSAINIITAISMLAFGVGAFALTTLLSALNGFETSIFKVYENYYPDLKVTSDSGKVFMADSAMFQKIQSHDAVAAWSAVLEDNAVISNGNNQSVCLLKGVDSNYAHVVQTDSLLVAGEGYMKGHSETWMAEGLFYQLNLGSGTREVTLMSPDRNASGVSQMDMVQLDLQITGVIRPGEEMDQKLVVSPLPVASELFLRENEISAIEIRLKPGVNAEKTAEELGAMVGNTHMVKTRKQQNQAVYKMFNTEKWVAFAMMAFVLLVISFNLIGSLSMLVIDKKKDIGILASMGGSKALVRKIFFDEGLLISMSGALFGMAVGVAAVLMQQRFGFIKTTATFVTAYPVELRVPDLCLVFGLCFVMGLSVSLYPALKSAQTN